LFAPVLIQIRRTDLHLQLPQLFALLADQLRVLLVQKLLTLPLLQLRRQLPLLRGERTHTRHVLGLLSKSRHTATKRDLKGTGLTALLFDFGELAGAALDLDAIVRREARRHCLLLLQPGLIGLSDGLLLKHDLHFALILRPWVLPPQSFENKKEPWQRQQKEIKFKKWILAFILSIQFVSPRTCVVESVP
jgi:hypothetical protein